MSRPSDFADDGFGDLRGDGPQNPRLGALEWLRWAWRQLTSMRTALLLLLALAVAAVPGSLIPQNSADPNGVINWKASNPGLVGVANALQLFDVYTSAWFSAIYLLLFISLVGCVVPRIAYHLKALRAAPPRTPSRLGRLPAYRSESSPGDPARALDAGERLLRRRRYRVARYGDSLSAERGYLRETGNLLFHAGLVGVLVSVFVGSGFTYTGQRVTVEGETFVNNQSNYDSLSTGRFFTDSTLQPYSLRLDSLTVKYEQQNPAALGEPLDYTARVTTRTPGHEPVHRIIKVNDPLEIGGSAVYLLGNGYAPHITVRNANGSIAFSGSVPFRPQDSNMTSLGVVKAEHTTSQARQIGLVGFLYPTVGKLSTGADTSIFPSLGDPLVSFNVWAGDLGLNGGATQNVYVLDTSRMKQVAARTLANKPIQLTRAQPTATLPDGLGTVHLDGIARYAALDIHHDPSQGWVAGFVVLTVAGLLTSLLVPRRRMWLKVTDDLDGGLRLEYAALARGDDPGLERAVGEFAHEHRRELEAPTPSAERVPAGV
ncbi:cytochrome c biogenesis protein ResB [Amnibacterium sp. CER49]|uniref:cytochrome c biogenesis protein ResB n=1 Tax=Amnibacterium sp. CER49 TaxID=3039161 RepID=UPI00244A4E8E|nr:cytochrome c biogenesis protein ResB [Amnibacterium sp. CER49]MDH2443417.1 cytochrome c biogenesis protein ResB [Amnibacterium sp. CER49]